MRGRPYRTRRGKRERPAGAGAAAGVPDVAAALGADYAAAFSADERAEHARAVARLCYARPADVRVGTGPGGMVEVTVVAFDFPGEFSLIAGVLTGSGLDVLSGDVFTSRAAAAPGARRFIIDRFRGQSAAGRVDADWTDAVARRLGKILSLPERGGAAGADAARQAANELVAGRLGAGGDAGRRTLAPVEITFMTGREPYTTLRVVSQDTPAFLYALSNALALQGVSIERVRIRTEGGRVEDELDVLDARDGRLIREAARLDRIRLAVLLTKQFTYFLASAPDPRAALTRFDRLAGDVLGKADRDTWLDLFSEPRVLADLARILGTSDFIWEDFVRNQYETLLPMLAARGEAVRIDFTRGALTARLRRDTEGADGFDALRAAVNAWKDREVFRIDLDHILHSGADVRALAEPLTVLAEVVVAEALRAVTAELAGRFGTPRTVGGLTAACAVFGLGKFGGVALGYASDIELLLVYSDNGRTGGPEPIENAEWFEHAAAGLAGFITAKREGIFHVDQRLRPYGSSGPKATSLEQFFRYYGADGPAHAFERLALTRLRYVAGDAALGARVERMRDELVYEGRLLRVEDLKRLRQRQAAEKADGSRVNAKFSPGALVDLEYDVQMLQVLHGGARPALRTPRIHEALRALSDAELLERGEAESLTEAYDFLRRLINGLRMLRGNARDLFLPETETDEYAHLARRMGYRRGAEMSPATRLRLDFETHTAVVRAFSLRHFGPDALPTSARAGVADLILAPEWDAADAARVLGKIGFRDLVRAVDNLRRLAGGTGAARARLVRLSILAADVLRGVPDPDMALNNWERFVRRLDDPAAHYALLLSQPKRLEILLAIFAGSQFLADVLIREPEFLDWATDAAVLHADRSRETIGRELEAWVRGAGGAAAFRNTLRRFRRREMLRIGTRDLCLRMPVRDVAADLSALAEAVIDAALADAWDRLRASRGTALPDGMAAAFSVLAFGKLGGGELNYSSDVDLMGLYDETVLPADVRGKAGELYAAVMERLRETLSERTEEGHAYRVDLRLRPYGRAGALTPSCAAAERYYSDQAALWETQALLKLRPVAGNRGLGARAVERLQAVVLRERDEADVRREIATMRERSVRTGGLPAATDVKSGLGGIRDIEFLVQGLQLIHAPADPILLTGHTLDGLERLATAGYLHPEQARTLAEDYAFLRRVEHCLQLLEDRQTHALPEAGPQFDALARRVLGAGTDPTSFRERLDAVRMRTRRVFSDFIHGAIM
jgi:[glutamine synthetase] adenylyltransferase / [glutamine synthetase]-adenylyl-L-tyrosine phosphorylase